MDVTIRRAPLRLLQCVLWWGLGLATTALGQFIDPFENPDLEGWSSMTGDGQATVHVEHGDGTMSVVVDATADRRNIWWALVKREVSQALDLALVAQPEYELRIEARLRVSHAPRRVNLHLNTQRTTDFHSHLKEFDIPDTLGWHTISMTTRGFDARPGDILNAQMALMDWGLGRYRVDVDYVRVDVVALDTVGADLGHPLDYHPAPPDPGMLDTSVVAAQDATIDLEYPDLNLNSWAASGRDGDVPVLAVGGTRLSILRWDLTPFAGRRIEGWGVLELTVRHLERADTPLEEFGKLRVVEIPAGDPDWDQRSVTLETLAEGQPLDDVFNTQMVIDMEIPSRPGDRLLVPLSPPVVQRLVDGKTKGLALRPLGSLHASFVASEDAAGAPRLHFGLAPDGD